MIEEIKGFIKKIIKHIEERMQQDLDERNEQAHAANIALESNRRYATALKLQDELASVFSTQRLLGLAPISAPCNIVINGWKETPNGILYSFLFPLSTPNASMYVSQYKSSMNRLLYQYQQMNIHRYGYESTQLFHPYIYAGLYIVAVEIKDSYLHTFVTFNNF